jgi:hypothetical protein
MGYWRAKFMSGAQEVEFLCGMSKEKLRALDLYFLHYTLHSFVGEADLKENRSVLGRDAKIFKIEIRSLLDNLWEL